jgi:hypothetical protein
LLHCKKLINIPQSKIKEHIFIFMTEEYNL